MRPNTNEPQGIVQPNTWPRFWSHVFITTPKSCWIFGKVRGDVWEPVKTKYGFFQWGRNLWLAHRVAWVLSRGRIQEMRLVCHKCDNPKCVNPFHLFIGTFKDNMQDMIKKGRNVNPVGTGLPQSKLTEGLVLEVRSE